MRESTRFRVVGGSVSQKLTRIKVEQFYDSKMFWWYTNSLSKRMDIALPVHCGRVTETVQYNRIITKGNDEQNMSLTYFLFSHSGINRLSLNIWFMSYILRNYR